jgi:hypothetical protein
VRGTFPFVINGVHRVRGMGATLPESGTPEVVLDTAPPNPTPYARVRDSKTGLTGLLTAETNWGNPRNPNECFEGTPRDVTTL